MNYRALIPIEEDKMRYGYRRHSILSIILFIIIILCIVAIAILTWLLFRTGGLDDGKIGTNVTSGKVKIDIEDTSGVSKIGDVFEFAHEEGEDVIFAPGMTYYTEGFVVKNEGNLTIKYLISVSKDFGTNYEAFKKAFDFYITTDPENLEGAQKLTDYEGTLTPGQTSVNYYLVITMKEDAGNEFQDKIFTGIGITVTATQINAKK